MDFLRNTWTLLRVFGKVTQSERISHRMQGSTEIDFFKQVLSFVDKDLFFAMKCFFFQSFDSHNSWQWSKVCTGVKMNYPHLKLFQFRGHQSLSLSQRSVAPVYALVNLRHGVRGATTAVCAAAEHAALQESMTHNGLGCCRNTS